MEGVHTGVHMLLLPKKIGHFTLQRKLGTGGITEAYVGTHDGAPGTREGGTGGKPVVVRRILPYVLRDPARLASIEARVKDLLGVRHPFLVHVVDHVQEGDEHFIVEEHIDGVTLEKVLAWCRQNQRTVPHNIFLNIATQVCNGLEALHGRTGKGTSAEHVLHLSLKPGAIFVTRDGKVMVGSYGLTRSPTTLPHGGVAGPVPTRMEYLSPEQTHPDQKLTPASDIFALGAVLYELLTLESLFKADSNLQTIHRVRRAEVTTQLLRVKEVMPGLDKVLYRALSLNPRHRYQRAFVLREDLRGLMAGYSFTSIAEDTRNFLQPLLDSVAPTTVDDAPDAPPDADSFADSPATRLDPDPIHTAAQVAQDAAARSARASSRLFADEFAPNDHTENTENTTPRGDIDPPTEVRAERPLSDELDRPTMHGQSLGDAATADDSTSSDPSGGAAPPDPSSSMPPMPPLPPMPLTTLTQEIADPSSTAAFIASERRESPPLSAFEPQARPAAIAPAQIGMAGAPAFASHERGPDSTAAFLAGELPLPPPPLVEMPTRTLPEPPAPTASGVYSRPMPGPNLSRPMPPPNLQAPPKPMAASTPAVAPSTLAPPAAAPLHAAPSQAAPPAGAVSTHVPQTPPPRPHEPGP